MRSAPPGLTTIAPELLVGARVRLRPWTDADRAPFAALNADPRVMEHFPAPLTRAQSDTLAERISANITEHGWGLWAAEHQTTDAETPRFIGFVGLNSPTADLPFKPCVEIGWRLAPDYWGQGLASMAARLALRVGFEALGLEEIVAFTGLRNTRSRAVMQGLGMQESVGYEFDHPAFPPDNPERRCCVYRLSHARWSTNPKNRS
jgi:RimJ/RimL family protein N-acetyltransferase